MLQGFICYLHGRNLWYEKNKDSSEPCVIMAFVYLQSELCGFIQVYIFTLLDLYLGAMNEYNGAPVQMSLCPGA